MEQGQTTVQHGRTMISVVLINYNGSETILQTIESLMGSEGVDVDIQVIDDCSTDDSVQLVRAKYPEIPIFAQGVNSANLNARRNEGLQRATHDKVLITDNDINFDKECLKNLNDILERDSSNVACIPRLMYWGDSTRIYQGGGLVHYIGAMVSPRRGQVRTEDVEIPPEPTVGGGIGLYRKSAFQELGAFDEGLEMAPWDDAEAHQRVWLAGRKVLYVDAAHGEHLAKQFDDKRHYRARGIIYNRWNYILTQYDRRTLILITPALLLFELVQLAFYSIKGIAAMYFQGTAQVWSLRKTIARKRKEVQRSREVSDRALITSGKIVVSEQTANNSKLVDYAVKTLSWLFSKYWVIVRPLIRTRA